MTSPERQYYSFEDDPKVQAILAYAKSPEGRREERRHNRIIAGVLGAVVAGLLGTGGYLAHGVPKLKNELAITGAENDNLRRCGLVVGQECESPLGLAPPKPQGCATATTTEFVMSKEELMAIAYGTIAPDVSEALAAPGVCAVDVVVDADDVPRDDAFEVTDALQALLPPLPEGALAIDSDPDMNLNGLVVHNQAVHL